MPFDPDKYLAKPVPFDPDKYLEKKSAPISPPPSKVTGEPGAPVSAYPELRKEMDRGIVESVTESPVFISKEITNADIAEVARKHNVPVEWLRSRAAFQGASLEGETLREAVDRVSGFVSGAVTAGGMQKLDRYMAGKVSGDKYEHALDDLSQLASARKSLLIGGGEIAIPGGAITTKSGKVLPKVAATVGTGALSGLNYSREGEEIPGMLGGSVAGGFLGGAAHYAGKAIGKGVSFVTEKMAALKDKVAGDVINRAERMGGADLQEQVISRIDGFKDADAHISDAILTGGIDEDAAAVIVGKYAPETAPEDIIQQANLIVDNAARRVATEFGAESAQDAGAAVRKWAGVGEKSGQGAEYAEERIRRSLAQRHILDVFSDHGVYSTDNGNVLSRAADVISDAQYVLRAADEKLPGLGIEAAHQQINRGLNLASFAREEFRNKLGKIFTGLVKTDKDDAARFASKLIAQVETAGEGKTPVLTAEQRAVYEPFREFFASGLKELDRLAKEHNLPPLAIKARDNYIPAQLLDSHQLDEVVKGRMGALLEDINTTSGRVYKDLAAVPKDLYNRVVGASQEHKDTLKFIRMIAGEDSDNLGALSRAVKSTFINPEVHGRLETLAKAALERSDMLPLWARETNMYKLADKWATNSVRHLFLREGLDGLNRAADILGNKKMGFERESKYIRNLLADINGVRQGTVAALTNRATRRWLRWADQKVANAGSKAERMKWETVRSVPMALQALGRNVHPNLLGANPRTLVMNLTQTFTKTLPEFGPVYGSLIALRGAMSVGRGKGLKGLGKTIAEMEAMGLTPAKYVGGSLPYLAEGVARTKPALALTKAGQKSAEIIMRPFEMAEKVNRAIAFRASQVFVDDLVRGSDVAIKALGKMPTAVQRNITESLASKNRAEALKVAATHIVNSTQYQYNRASMSEYGRTMGPMFSVFTKWPTATAGQVIESYRTKGLSGAVKDNTHKLIYPFLLLELADRVYLYARDNDEFSPAEAKIVSRSGLSQAAPIGNLVGIAKGEFFTPPAVDIATKAFVRPVLNGEFDSLGDSMGKGVQESLYQFAPGAAGGWIRFLTDDVVTLVEDERPEGGFVEKAVKAIE